VSRRARSGIGGSDLSQETTMPLRLALAALMLAAVPAVTTPTPVAAQIATPDTQGADRLFDALGLPDLVEVMRAEGIVYGEEIAGQLFPGRDPDRFLDEVARIYEPARLENAMRDAFATALGDAETADAIAFFEGDPGARIVSLEVGARQARLDEDVEAAADERAALARADGTDRLALVERFIDANDLVEANVVGALNANYAFYLGLADGGAFPGEVSADEMLADVWAQEDEIRASTTDWLHSFLLMAYGPLADEEIETYIAFSETDAGRRTNAALFAAFDEMFVGVSRALGQGAARFMASEEL